MHEKTHASLDSSDTARRRTVWQCVKKWVKRTIAIVVVMVTAYLVACLIGLLPVNRSFAQTTDGIEIYVTSNGVHTFLVLPTIHPELNWRTHFRDDHFVQANPWKSHVAFSWGDRDFFIETPTWSDMRLTTTLTALAWPTDTVVHVEHVDQPPVSGQSRRVMISRDQYRRLTDYLLSAFCRDADGKLMWIEGAHYSNHDAFYHARGRYHLLNTCNVWSGQALRRAGVRTALWSPFPHGVLWQLPAE